MLCLFQHAVDGLDHGGLVRHGAKLVVEYGLADDVQRDTERNKKHNKRFFPAAREWLAQVGVGKNQSTTERLNYEGVTRRYRWVRFDIDPVLQKWILELHLP